MQCQVCSLVFDEKLGTTCPKCKTTYILKDNVIVDVILNVKCTNCGSLYHKEWYVRRGKTYPIASCKTCKKTEPYYPLINKIVPKKDETKIPTEFIKIDKHIMALNEPIDSSPEITKKPYKQRIFSSSKLIRPINLKCPVCKQTLYNINLDGVYYYCHKCKMQYPLDMILQLKENVIHKK